MSLQGFLTVVALSVLSPVLAAQATDTAVTPVDPIHTAKGASRVSLTASASILGPNQSVTITANGSVMFSLSGTAGGLLEILDSRHAIYTAPSHIPISSPIAGCGSFPNDSIYNTPINNLPVHSNSVLWLSPVLSSRLWVEPSFGYNVITEPGFPTMPMKYYYGGGMANAPVLRWPSKKREGGWDASPSDSTDHHTLIVTAGANACHFYELYNDVISTSTTNQCQNGSTGCNASSGDDYDPTTYSLVAETDAAGLPQYLTLRLDEIKNNAIHHPTRFTLARGFIQSAASGTPHLWPAVGSNGWGSRASLPFGARLRLKADHAISGKSQYARNILNSFKQYGLILSDTGTNGAIQTGTDVWEDPNVISAVFEAVSGLSFADFEVVDESSLMLASNSTQVNPNNGYVLPPDTARIAAHQLINAGRDPAGILDLTLVGVGIGLRNPQVSALVTGSSYSYDFSKDAWVTGTSNQVLSWSLVSGPGSVTSSGVYMFPASVSQVTEVVLQASSGEDPQATATQYLLLYPVSQDGNFRTALGGQFVDSAKNLWWHLAGIEGGIIIQTGGDYPSWASLNGNGERSIYQSSAYGDNSDLHWRFMVPNGHYKVRFLLGQTLNGCFNNCTLDPSTHRPVAIGVNGQIDSHWYLWGEQANDQAGMPWDYFAPGEVTDNVIDIWMGKINPDGDSYRSFPQASGIEIMPDHSAPHISIDTGIEGWNSVTSAPLALPLKVPGGSTRQLYAVGWYMSSAVTWSISGPGKINSATGLYTAPPIASATPQYVTVKATSSINSSITATATIVVQ